jgi:hypothetical protein
VEDIGIRFGRDRSFCFDVFVIDEILFDDTDDITLYCRVPYFGEEYFATFGLTFEQLNIILRSIRSAAEPIATALAEKLNDQIEIPTTLRIEDIYSIPLEVTSVILHCTLYELTDEDEDEPDEEDEEDENEDKEEYVAYAFLVDDIDMLPPTS